MPNNKNFDELYNLFAKIDNAEDFKILLDDLCTCCLQGVFHSHRATGGKRGTLALMIGII